jgi:2-keto-4-pentenoate hydratase/2-oxohepta-3-ene-1,7-dioic acid hydratase in catechol pathway
MNFRDHAGESKMEIPSQPVLLFKATSSLTGSQRQRRNTAEHRIAGLELVVIVVRKVSCVAQEAPFSDIAGYALHNDYWKRGFQLERGGLWMRYRIPRTWRMWLKVNREMRRIVNTANMIFDLPTGGS